MKILLTGGNGFIGSHTADKLVEMGHEVSIIDLKLGEHLRYLGRNLVQGDVCDKKTVERITMRPDLIFHLAAVSRVEWGEIDPERCLKVNVLGLLNVISWIRKTSLVPHIILASSREVYGEARTPLVSEEHPKEPKSIYGIGKLMAEKLLVRYAQEDTLKYTIVRFSNVYGSIRDLPERVTPRFVATALEGRPLTVNGGNQVLDFTFIDDVVDGITSLISHIERRNQSVFDTDLHFTSGRGCSVLEMAHLVKTTTGSDSEIRIAPERGWDVKRFVGDYSKARQALSYRPRTGLEDGLSEYVRRVRSSQDGRTS